MTVRIDKFVSPIVNYCIWRDGFTEEEIDQIRNIGELQEFQKGLVGSSEGDILNPNTRETDIVWIEPTYDHQWIFEKMRLLAKQVNYDNFQANLAHFDGFQYSKYNVDGHYDWHIDTQNEPRHGLFRKISFSLMLSDPEEYEGGEFMLCTNGNVTEVTPIKLKKGDLIAFYSYLPHKVAPVTRGVRIALVTWAMGEKFI